MLIMKKVLALVSITLCSWFARGQAVCSNPGQTPSTAFPVCGTSVFTQNTVPVCGGRRLPSPSCSTDPIGDKNPFWYKFTCFQSGTLGFLITPKDLASDYDWELYDITGKDPNDIYIDGKLVVASNWSGEYGLTGASAAGTQRFVCAGGGKALFSSMPPIQAGHEYLLLISHFSNTQFGYDLSFGGGTAVITDTKTPRFEKAEASCGGNAIVLKMNKKIKCSSIASDGSDFFVTSGTSSPTSSAGIGCSVKFDTDSIEIKLNQFLQPGNYTIHVKQGADGNTLLDYCNQPVPASDAVDFSVAPVPFTPMDSIVPLKCAPNSIRLVFDKPIICNSIATDGSDFRLNGPYPVAISSAKGNCTGTGSGSNEIVLSLSQPLQRTGTFSLALQNGSDGNTIFNECGIQTPAGSSLSFSIQDTVSADFAYTIQYACTEDVVDFSHDGRNGVTQWRWNLDDNIARTGQNVQARYRVFDKKDIQLVVTNGFCTDTSRQSFILDNFLTADFVALEDHCHSEPVVFKSTSTGKIVSHSWQFGDGTSATGDTLNHVYAPPARTTAYVVRHTVTDIYGCSKSVDKKVNIYINCQIDVPNAFTPDSDSKNDILYPLNAVKAAQLVFKVYNRWGQLIFHTTDWKKGWDGKYNGQLQPGGTYVWTLQYTHRDTNQAIYKKGTTMLIR